MSYIWATATHVGRVRSGNEDSVYPEAGGAGDGPFLAVVADGMGGAVGGEVASRLAVEAVVDTDGDPESRVVAANEAIVSAVVADPTLAGMGTTTTLGIFQPDGSVEIGHVGDSRAYRLRAGEMEQLTTDHSLVAELLAAGRIKAEDVRTHPQRNLVTRALGMAQRVPVDTMTEQLEPGDRMLLCSDGLNGMLGDEEIQATITAHRSDLAELAAALIEQANNHGGEDNCTVILIEVCEE